MKKLSVLAMTLFMSAAICSTSLTANTLKCGDEKTANAGGKKSCCKKGDKKACCKDKAAADKSAASTKKEEVKKTN